MHIIIRINMVITDTFFPHPQSRLLHVKPRILFDGGLDNVDESDFPDFRYEATRLNTFRNWPSLVVRPDKLAAAGFYFPGQGDTVKCFTCHIQLNNWQEGDDPIADHRRYSPQCKFVCKVPCGNVPLNNINRRSVTGINEIQNIEREYFSYLLHRAKHPEYCNYLKRLATFNEWPSTKKQDPTELAEAGFYHVGCEDQVLCFYCGVALRNWEDNDIPWEAHAKWMPECFYVLNIKGHDYVSSVNLPEGRDVTEQTLELGATNYLVSLPSDEPIPFVVSEGYDEDNEDSIQAAFKILQLREQFLKAEAEEIERAEKEKDQEKVLEKKNNQEEKDEELVDDTLQCKICFAKKRNILFLTCGHVVSCNTCSKMVNNVCPVCRKRIMGMMQITIV